MCYQTCYHCGKQGTWGVSVEETSSIFHNRGKDPEEFIAKLLKVASVSLILWCFPLAPCLGQICSQGKGRKALTV